MAVSAKFIADFTSFDAAVKKAEIELRSFEAEAHRVGPALNRMVDQFSGRKLIQEATMMSRVLGDAGSIARLTGRELQAAGAKASEAAEKMRRLGVDVPPGLQRIADAAKNAGAGATSASGGFKSLLGSVSTVNSVLGAFGVAVSVAALTRFVGGVFEAASGIHDMSLKLGISAEAVQGFKFAAEQAGSSLDAVGTAITRMNVNLSEGDKGTVSALKKAGVEFATIRSMKPEQAFLAIADAIQKIPDPMVQSDVALKLFGKSAAELLPAIKEGFRAAAEGAAKMSNETIKELEAAQDAWSKLGNAVTIVTGSMIAKVIAFKNTLLEQNFGLMGGAAAAKKMAGDIQLLPQVIHKTAEELSLEEKALEKAAAASLKLAAAKVTAAKALRDFHNEMGVQFIRDVQAADKATLEAAASLRAFNNEIGAQHIKDIENTNEAVEDTAAAMRALNNELGVLDMEARAHEFAFVGPILDTITKKSSTFGQQLDDLAGTMVQLAQVSGDSFGGLLKTVAQVAVAISGAAKALEVYRASSTQTVAGNAAMAASWMTLSFSLVKLAASFLEMSAAEKEALRVARDFRKELAELATVEQRLQAQRATTEGGHRRQRASNLDVSLVVLTDIYKALGLAATQAAHDMKLANGGDQESIDNIRENIDAHQSLIDAAHAMGSFTQAELQAVADRARDVYDFMERAGTYSAEQLADAWEASNRATQIALGDTAAIAASAAEAAGFRTKAQLEKTAQDAEAMYLYIRDSGLFTASEAEKAWAEVFGSHEDLYGDAADTIEQSRAAFDAANAALSESALAAAATTADEQAKRLEEQMDTQTEDIKAQVEDVAASLETALGGIRPQAIRVPVIFDIPAFPFGGSSVTMPETGGRSGGGGTAVVEVEGRVLAEVAVPHLAGAIERYGLFRR